MHSRSWSNYETHSPYLGRTRLPLPCSLKCRIDPHRRLSLCQRVLQHKPLPPPALLALGLGLGSIHPARAVCALGHNEVPQGVPCHPLDEVLMALQKLPGRACERSGRDLVIRGGDCWRGGEDMPFISTKLVKNHSKAPVHFADPWWCPMTEGIAKERTRIAGPGARSLKGLLCEGGLADHQNLGKTSRP
jgi:hypothetical protein